MTSINVNFILGLPGLLAAGICAGISLVITFSLIISHYLAYREPVLQRACVRILFMLPVYAITSYVSLLAPDAAFYLTTIRDLYEAYALYVFVALMVSSVGGAARLIDLFRETDRHFPASWFLGTCCLRNIPLNAPFLRRTIQGVLQFVIVKLVLVSVSILLEVMGKYHEGQLTPDTGYFWITFVYNISISIALYSLIVFWSAAAPFLKPFKPTLKFLFIKGLIFVLFWQSFVLALMTKWGTLQPLDGHTAAETNLICSNFLVCIESILFAVLGVLAFRPKKVYPGWSRAAPPPWPVSKALLHSLSLIDVLQETRASFSPGYQGFSRMESGVGPAASAHASADWGRRALMTVPAASLLPGFTDPSKLHSGMGPGVQLGRVPTSKGSRQGESEGGGEVGGGGGAPAVQVTADPAGVNGAHLLQSTRIDFVPIVALPVVKGGVDEGDDETEKESRKLLRQGDGEGGPAAGSTISIPVIQAPPKSSIKWLPSVGKKGRLGIGTDGKVQGGKKKEEKEVEMDVVEPPL